MSLTTHLFSGFSPNCWKNIFAIQVDQYIHRILVEEDAVKKDEGEHTLFAAASEAGKKLYKRGDFSESQTPNLDVYLLKKVKEHFQTHVACLTVL